MFGSKEEKPKNSWLKLETPGIKKKKDRKKGHFNTELP